jgi:hypothetical protein
MAISISVLPKILRPMEVEIGKDKEWCIRYVTEAYRKWREDVANAIFAGTPTQ